MDVTLVLENKQGVAEIEEKSDQIKRAFHLILREYKGAQFKEEQKATITKILRRIFKNLLSTRVLEIKYHHYEIQKYQPNS